MTAVATEDSTELTLLLAQIVTGAADGKATAWFNEALGALATGYDRNAFLAAYAGADRRLRAFDATLSAADIKRLEMLGTRALEEWPLSRFARCAFISTVLGATPAMDHAAILDEIFRSGDNSEREALLAGLAAFPDPTRFLETAIESCRSNVETVFAAIACENAYPSLYFPEASFNQMVMKTVFIGLPLARVVGLEGRRNSELSRMAEHFAAEREAAGREVPSDLDLITANVRPA